MSYKRIILGKYKSNSGFVYILRCINCKRVFKTTAYKVEKRKGGKFCSRDCVNKYQKKHPHTKSLLGVTGKQHPYWKGGRFTNQKGYVLIRKPNHPNANCNGYILEHRFVMSEKLGRPLKSNERVHHLNGTSDDNRPENLELFKNEAEHFKKYHGKDWNKRVKKDEGGKFIPIS